MSQKPQSTMSDVARRAKVSTATVSRALSAPHQVQENTRKRVLQAITDLGYAPNFGARVLAAKQTNTFGVVIPTMENAVFARGIQAFQEELGRHGKTLLIASSGYQSKLEDEQVRTLVARGADALLLIGYDRPKELYDFLDRRSVPTLVIWSFSANEARTAIGFDNRKSMAELASLVIAYGHTRIGCLSAPTADNDRARARVDGIKSAMTSAGLDCRQLELIETPYAIENAELAFHALMNRAPRTTAVICGNDVLAIGALRAAREMDLRVPEDVSITGFDDLEIALLAEPALTTVHVPHRQMGRRAARMLIQMLNQTGELRSVELQTEIKQRYSLAPAP
ncbi:MAG: LacI family DNA-binding transcriptional regulator [Aestuariivita sp.]|nr:LacI family DNA-binding transcriptional regulator [Aestuariivita sp.]